jgi:hypothetical protein
MRTCLWLLANSYTQVVMQQVPLIDIKLDEKQTGKLQTLPYTVAAQLTLDISRVTLKMLNLLRVRVVPRNR